MKKSKKKKEESIEENVKQKYPFADEMLTTIRQEYERQCKIVCVFGKKWLLFGKNYDMKILIEKEYFYGNRKGANSTNYYRQ